jgi:hypothetical protein
MHPNIYLSPKCQLDKKLTVTSIQQTLLTASLELTQPESSRGVFADNGLPGSSSSVHLSGLSWAVDEGRGCALPPFDA